MKNNLKKEKQKRVSYFHRTATTTYPCFVPNLGDSAGAGRERLTRCEIKNKINIKTNAYLNFKK